MTGAPVAKTHVGSSSVDTLLLNTCGHSSCTTIAVSSGIDHFTWGLATANYVAMVTPILYDNSYSLNDSNLKYESYWPYG